MKEKAIFVIRKPHEAITEADVQRSFQQLSPRDKQQFLCLRENASRPFTQMAEACAENSFEISQSEPIATPAHGLFLLMSRFNHSCIPSSKIPTTSGETIRIYATRNITAGEEITFSYNSDFECRTRNDRHEKLRFVCDCKACLLGTPFQKLSDQRRTLIRGLQYLTRGEDIDGQNQKTFRSLSTPN